MRRQTRSALLLLTTSLLLTTLPGAAAGRDGNTVGVAATVARHFSSEVIEDSTVITVTAEDVARGWVEVKSAAKVMVRTNARHAFIFRIADPRFYEVRVEGLGSEVIVGKSGGFAPQPLVLGKTTYELGYRISLGEEVVPGTYEVPVSCQVRSIG